MATRVPYLSFWPHAIVLSAVAGLSLKIQRGGNEVNVATPSVLNIADLLTRVDNDRALVSELFSIFKSVFPNHLQRLNVAVSNQLPERVEAEGHTLKGMLLSLSAVRAAAIAGNLETMGRERAIAGMAEALAAFQNEVEALLLQMELIESQR
jgi:HPt (histidine-containing phosphotransfer) domain-containing protein